MVIVRLTGGLGNQLFQYAAARRLAHVNKTQLILDILSICRDPLRSYALEPFNIRGKIADKIDVAEFQGRSRVRAFRYWLQLRLPNRHWQWIRQRTLKFDPQVLEVRGNIYLDGAWQNEGYFRDIGAILREELSLRNPLSGKNADVAEQIIGDSSVSIHIRRGDYIHNPKTSRIHNVVSMEYYSRALGKLEEKVEDIRCFVFSDEPDWVKQHLRLCHPLTIIEHNLPHQSHEDLRLMSLCKHHIIANSSFSWWGAWLCPHPDKMVFAPSRWFNHVKDDVIADIVPPEWQLVDV